MLNSNLYPKLKQKMVVSIFTHITFSRVQTPDYQLRKHCPRLVAIATVCATKNVDGPCMDNALPVTGLGRICGTNGLTRPKCFRCVNISIFLDVVFEVCCCLVAISTIYACTKSNKAYCTGYFAVGMD